MPKVCNQQLTNKKQFLVNITIIKLDFSNLKLENKIKTKAKKKNKEKNFWPIVVPPIGINHNNVLDYFYDHGLF